MRCRVILIFCLIPVFSFAADNDSADQTPRPSSWAQPLALNGLPNLHRVSETLYRGAKPTADGFRELQKLGVKTIVNLEIFHSDDDEIKESGTSFVQEHIRMESWRAEEDEIVRFLKIAVDPEKSPVFVHCYHGADRTGTMVAFYRIVVQNWSKDDAIKEMKEGGFGYHAIWKNLITFIRETDTDRLKKEIGQNPHNGTETPAESRSPTMDGQATFTPVP